MATKLKLENKFMNIKWNNKQDINIKLDYFSFNLLKLNFYSYPIFVTPKTAGNTNKNITPMM